MKRFNWFICLLLIASGFLWAADEVKSLEVATVVPVDYGVLFPADGLHVDRLYLALEKNGGDRTFLTTDDTFLDTGLITSHPNGLVFEFLFYGNLDSDYTVEVSADGGRGFVLQGRDIEYNIPLDISFSEPDELPEGVTLDIRDDVTAVMNVRTLGAESALEVLNLNLSWVDSPDSIAGEYMADLSVKLTTL